MLRRLPQWFLVAPVVRDDDRGRAVGRVAGDVTSRVGEQVGAVTAVSGPFGAKESGDVRGADLEVDRIRCWRVREQECGGSGHCVGEIDGDGHRYQLAVRGPELR